MRALPRAPPTACAGPLLDLPGAPVSCYHGEGDPLVDEERITEWAGVTSGAFTLRVRPGGHFHVSNDVAALVADVLGGETA